MISLWLVASLVCFALALVCLYNHLKARRAAVVISRIQPVPIAEAGLGSVVRLEGWAASAGRMAFAPLSRTECLWSSWLVRRVDERVDNGGNSIGAPSQDVESGTTATPFAITDHAGAQVLLLPAEAQAVSLGERREWLGTTPRPEPSGARPVGTGTQLLRALRGAEYRYTEHRLVPEAPIFAVGLLEPPRPEDGPRFRGRIACGQDGVPFLIGGEAPDAARATLGDEARDTQIMAVIFAVIGCVFGVVALL